MPPRTSNSEQPRQFAPRSSSWAAYLRYAGGITLLVCLTNRRPEGIDALEDEHDEDFEKMDAAKLADPSARWPTAVAGALKELIKSKEATHPCLCHEKKRARLDLASALKVLEELLSSTPAPVDDAPLPVASSGSSTAAPHQPTPTLLLREIGKAAVAGPQEEAERRLQHYVTKGFNDFMRMLERHYGAAPPELKEFEKVQYARRPRPTRLRTP